jgi:hypothetical protein
MKNKKKYLKPLNTKMIIMNWKMILLRSLMQENNAFFLIKLLNQKKYKMTTLIIMTIMKD